MHVLSVTWLLWMWLAVSLYWLVPRDGRGLLLVVITAVFLLVHDPRSAVLLAAFTLITHAATRAPVVTTRAAIAAIGTMVAVLFLFKVGQTVQQDWLLHTLVIPLGLSYYTFRCIHVVLERLKGHLPPLPLAELTGYLFFLPTIVVGPIHRVDDYRRDLVRQRFDPALLSEGAERIIYGYAKITILGNVLVESQFGGLIATLPEERAALILYLVTVQTGLNLYFQFSGFSDIAIGFARLLGFRVLENFNWPYLQSNISAFWRCWHMSLSQWCRNYIFGVVVSMTRSPTLGVLATMITIGLWHEISLRFLLWGAYHGLGIIVWQRTAGWGERLDRAVPAVLAGPLHGVKVLLTVHFVWFGFVILTAETPLRALDTFRIIFLSWV